MEMQRRSVGRPRNDESLYARVKEAGLSLVKNDVVGKDAAFPDHSAFRKYYRKTFPDDVRTVSDHAIQTMVNALVDLGFLVKARSENGSEVYVRTDKKAEHDDSVGFAKLAAQAIARIDGGKLRTFKHKENWWALEDDANSAGYFEALREKIDADLEEDANVTFDLKFMIADPEFVEVKLYRIAGLVREFSDYCNKISPKIAQFPNYKNVPGPNVSGDNSDELKLVPMRESIAREIRSQASKVDQWLYDDYLALKSLTERVREIAKGKKKSRYRCEVRVFGSWQSFPTVILNDEIAVVGCYPTNVLANESPATLVDKKKSPLSPWMSMALGDFEATWNQSVAVLHFTHEPGDPNAGAGNDSVETEYGSSMMRPKAARSDRLDALIGRLLDNFANMADPCGPP